MSYPVQMWKLGSIFIISAIFILTAPCVFCSTCGAHECPTGPHTCCPMCEAGSYVVRHCEKSSPTVCEQCPTTTFTDEENGLLRCKSCTVCDSKAGLKVRRKCSPTSDTLCEPLEGHWCTDPIKDGCLRAVEHTKCSPEQYVKEKGTAYFDTRCETRGHGTVSDGSSTSCRSHTQHDTDMEEHGTKRVASSSFDDCDKAKTGTAIALVSFMATLIFTCVARSPQRTLQPLMFSLMFMGICGVLCAYVCGLNYFCVCVSVIGCVGICVCVCVIRLCGTSFIFFERD